MYRDQRILSFQWPCLATPRYTRKDPSDGHATWVAIADKAQVDAFVGENPGTISLEALSPYVASSFPLSEERGELADVVLVYWTSMKRNDQRIPASPSSS